MRYLVLWHGEEIGSETVAGIKRIMQRIGATDCYIKGNDGSYKIAWWIRLPEEM